MSGFSPTGATSAGLDPTKRVNYRLGLVLGEDEFRQDQFHLRERDQYAVRALHGYGTVSGLGVRYDAGEQRLHVQPGVAVDPAGHLICVPAEYCGSLKDWVDAQLASDGVSGGSPTDQSVYVVLCWTECETDQVPIPASSCLSAEDSKAASRVKDSFELKLTLVPPPIVGEMAASSGGDGLEVLVDELHGLLDVAVSSPPAATGVAELLREWAVERRPEVAQGKPCLSEPDAPCLLLARVDVALSPEGDGLRIDSAVVDDSERPILVSTRLLQEAMFAVAADEAVPVHHHALADLGDVDLSTPPQADQALVFDGAHWVAGAVPGGGLGAAGGDLRGTYPDPSIDRLQNIPLSAANPLERDTLMLRNGTWESFLPVVLPLATVQLFQDLVYAVWFNLDAPDNQVDVDPDTVMDGLSVARETEAGPSFLRRIGPVSVKPAARNVVLVEVRESAPLVRFTFDLTLLKLTQGGVVQDWADKIGAWFSGQGQNRGLVTQFVLRPDKLG